MKFPEKYISRGRRKLHSGQESDIFYDVNALLTDRELSDYVVGQIPFSKHYVGIATGGAIIADSVAKKNGSLFSMVKDGELKGEYPKDDWILIDDVATTGNSLKEAIGIIGKNPSKIYVCVDRRTGKKDILVEAIFEI